MDNIDVKKMVEFLQGHNTAEDVNRVFLIAEHNALSDIESVNEFARLHNITVTVNEKYEVAKEIERLTGIRHVEYVYKHDLKKVTARVNHINDLFYTVRESCWDYYSFLNAEVKKDSVKMTSIHLFGDDIDESNVIHHYSNGKSLYKLTPELAERIELIKWIDSFFNPNKG